MSDPLTMRILVTGGAGFLGSHLCEKLLHDGHKIICLDNLCSGRKSNIAHLLDHPNFEFILHDVTHPVIVAVDRIYHLACQASPILYQKNPIETMKTCVIGTMNMLELAKRNNARFLLTSTSEVYGDPLCHPQKEDYWGNVNPIGIRACYDEGKRAAETLSMDYYRMENVDIRIARIFNTYGPRMRVNDGRVVSNFVVQALCNEPITVFSNGEQTRSFCYVDDLIEGIIKLMEQHDTIGPVNLGRPEEISINQLAEMVIKEIGETSSAIVFKRKPSDDPCRRLPDITKAKKYLQWYPNTSLEDGLKATILYFRDQLPQNCS